MEDKTRIFTGKYTKRDYIDTIKESVEVMKTTISLGKKDVDNWGINSKLGKFRLRITNWRLKRKLRK